MNNLVTWSALVLAGGAFVLAVLAYLPCLFGHQWNAWQYVEEGSCEQRRPCKHHPDHQESRHCHAGWREDHCIRCHLENPVAVAKKEETAMQNVMATLLDSKALDYDACDLVRLARKALVYRAAGQEYMVVLEPEVSHTETPIVDYYEGGGGQSPVVIYGDPVTVVDKHAVLDLVPLKR